MSEEPNDIQRWYAQKLRKEEEEASEPHGCLQMFAMLLVIIVINAGVIGFFIGMRYIYQVLWLGRPMWENCSW